MKTVVIEDMELAQIIEKVNKSVEKLKKSTPIRCNGAWTNDNYINWTDRFWFGLLWLCYKLTNDEKYLGTAYKWLEMIEYRKQNKSLVCGDYYFVEDAMMKITSSM